MTMGLAKISLRSDIFRFDIPLVRGVSLATAAALLLLAGSALAQTQPPAGMGSVQLVSPLRPVFEVEPGHVTQTELVLANHGAEVARVKISQTDFITNDTGESMYPEAGTLPRSNASWIAIDHADVQIAPGAQVSVPYSIHVPNDPELVGSYWSMIMVEAFDGTTTQASPGADGVVSTSVRVTFRYAVSVLVNLGESGQNDLVFADPDFARVEDGNDYRLGVNLQNAGDRVVTPKVWLELIHADGTQLGRFAAEEQRVFPGGGVHVQFPLESIEAGEYQALVIADAGGDQVFGVRYTLNVKAP